MNGIVTMNQGSIMINTVISFQGINKNLQTLILGRSQDLKLPEKFKEIKTLILLGLQPIANSLRGIV